jgi:hypothetical protein
MALKEDTVGSSNRAQRQKERSMLVGVRVMNEPKALANHHPKNP